MPTTYCSRFRRETLAKHIARFVFSSILNIYLPTGWRNAEIRIGAPARGSDRRRNGRR